MKAKINDESANMGVLKYAHHWHAQWKETLRAAVLTGESIDTTIIQRDDCCELGKWLYGDGQKLYWGNVVLRSRRSLPPSHSPPLSALPAHAADTIKVGILHSLSGTMAISETVLKDTVLMAIDEINAKGGVMGKKLEPVVVDPPPTGLCLLKKPSSCWGRTRFPSSLAAGRRCRASRCCRCGRNERPAVLPRAVRR
jgi:hypothetical protein